MKRWNCFSICDRKGRDAICNIWKQGRGIEENCTLEKQNGEKGFQTEKKIRWLKLPLVDGRLVEEFDFQKCSEVVPKLLEHLFKIHEKRHSESPDGGGARLCNSLIVGVSHCMAINFCSPWHSVISRPQYPSLQPSTPPKLAQCSDLYWRDSPTAIHLDYS